MKEISNYSREVPGHPRTQKPWIQYVRAVGLRRSWDIRGTVPVKVLAVRYGTGTLLVRSRYAAGTLQVLSRYASVVVLSRYTRSMLVVLSRYHRGMLVVLPGFARQSGGGGINTVRRAVHAAELGVWQNGGRCYAIDVWGMDRREPLEKTKGDNMYYRESQSTGRRSTGTRRCRTAARAEHCSMIPKERRACPKMTATRTRRSNSMYRTHFTCSHGDGPVKARSRSNRGRLKV